MDEKEEQLIRLQKKLKFLRDSLEADIISKEEYEKGKDKVERKIKELEAVEFKEDLLDDNGKIQKKIEHSEEQLIVDEEEPEEKTEPKETDIKIEPYKEEKEELKQESQEAAKEEPEEEAKEKPEEKHEIKEQITRERKFSKTWIWVSLAILVILVSAYMYSVKSPQPTEETPSAEEKIIQEMLPIGEIKQPACNSNEDCKQESMIGVCSSPQTENASCSFSEPVKVNLTIVNDQSCKSCDTKLTLSIIKKLFPGIERRDVDYASEEGRDLISKFGIEALPAYILDSDLESQINYGDIKRAFLNKNGTYVMSPYSSGANYYFKRKAIERRIELFAVKNSSNTAKAEENMKEVVRLFGKNITFEIHLIDAEKKDKMSEELDINTYPVFLINNQHKLNGIRPADAIKQEFCNWNKLDACSAKLSMDLK